MTAHARRTDPQTSHDAAASISEEKIRRSQQDVLRALRRVGPCDDTALVSEITSHTQRYAEQRESGIRTRRKELEAANLVEYTGETTLLSSGRRAKVWQAK